MFLIKKVVNKLLKKKLTISFAESCTGGLISSSITSIPNASKIFKMGLITYSNKSKNKLLKIKKKTLLKYGAVSEPVCYMMVNNLGKIARTDIALSVTGIAGPNGGTPKKPVGLVYLGIKKGNKIKVKKYIFKNRGRAYIQKITLNKSLKLILSVIK